MSPSSEHPRREVHILRREQVMPANRRQKESSFFLSCLDLMWQATRYNQRLIFYEAAVKDQGRLSERDQHGGAGAVMENLKGSLALCLMHYYHWCGRIAKGEPPACRLYIDSSDAAGVEFVEACIDLPLSHFAKDGFQMKPLFEELCQHIDHTGDFLFSSPLLSIQATLFSDGGLALGITHSHLVADGQSLWNFLVSWGECSRSVSISLTPLHNRDILAVPDPSPEKATWSLKLEIKEEDLVEEVISSSKVNDAAVCMSQDHNGSNEEGSHSSKDKVEEVPSSTKDGEKNKLDPDPLVQCMLQLSALAVKKLKAEAGEGYTSFEVACAHFWRRVAVARAYPLLEPTYFYLPVNCRTRTTPAITPSYFGNVVVFDVIVSTVGAICREPLGATARRIHDAVANMKEEYLVSFMHWMETHNNNLMGARSHSRPIGKGHNVASSPWFPAYQVDFGWGKPAAVRAVRLHGDGELVLFGGRPGSAKGDMEICTALRESVLRRLLRDPAFLAQPPSSPFGE